MAEIFFNLRQPLMLWIIPPFLAVVCFVFGWAKAWEFTRESREFQRKANLCPGSALLLLQSASMCDLHKAKYCTQEKRSLELKFSTIFVAEERNFCSCTFPMEMYRVIFHYYCCSLLWHFLVLPLPVCVNYLHWEVFKVKVGPVIHWSPVALFWGPGHRVSPWLTCPSD